MSVWKRNKGNYTEPVCILMWSNYYLTLSIYAVLWHLVGLDSTLQLVLFIKFIVNTVSVEWWLIHAKWRFEPWFHYYFTNTPSYLVSQSFTRDNGYFFTYSFVSMEVKSEACVIFLYYNARGLLHCLRSNSTLQ